MKNLKKGNAAHIIYQLIKAIQYCHKYMVIHRNLAPENILIQERDKKEKFNTK